jgi:chaperonin GroEL (HSP60 family)
MGKEEETKSGIGASLEAKRILAASGAPLLSEETKVILKAAGIDPDKQEALIRQAILTGKTVVGDIYPDREEKPIVPDKK